MHIISFKTHFYSTRDHMSYDALLDEHILSIIKNTDVHEQNELQHKLTQVGYKVPQATLSRRLKKLNIAKISGSYQVVDFNLPHLPTILNIQASDSGLVVLHTHPGHASSLGYFIDQKFVALSAKESDESGILGTIAGDDTVLLIIKSTTHLNRVLELLQKEFPYLNITALLK